jgi:hypothetical protein
MLRSIRQLSLTAVLALALNAGCTKQVTVNGQDVAANKNKIGQSPTGSIGETPQAIGGPPATDVAPAPTPSGGEAKPSEVVDGLSSERTHYQSRSTIVLTVSGKAAQAGDEYSLVNRTTSQILIDREALALNLVGPLLPGYLLKSSSSGAQVRLYPMAPELDGTLAYGENELELTVDGEAPRVAKHRIVLRDFSTGAVQTLFFDGNRQRAGKLQGEISTLTKPSTRSSKSRITTGFVPLINH